MQFDAKAFLENEIGRPAQVAELLGDGKHAGAPTSAAIEKWYQRAAIPGHALALLLFLLERKNRRPISLKRYFERRPS